MADFKIEGVVDVDVMPFVRGMQRVRAQIIEAGKEVGWLSADIDKLGAKSVNIKIKADASSAIDEIAALESLMHDEKITIDVKANTGVALDELIALDEIARSIDGKDVNLKAEVDGTAKVTEEMAALSLEVKALNGKNVRIDFKEHGLNALKMSITSLIIMLGPFGGGTIDGFTSRLAMMGGVASTVAMPALWGLVGVLATGLIPILGVAIGGVAGLVGVISVLAMGVGAFAAFAIPSFMEVTKAVTQLTAAQKKIDMATNTKQLNAAIAAQTKLIKGMNPAVAEMVVKFNALKTEYKKLAAELRPAVFGIASKGLDVLRQLMVLAAPVAKTMAVSIGHVMDNINKGLKSKTWTDFFGYLKTTAGPMFETLMTGFGNLITGFVAMVQAFDPLSKQFNNGFLGMTQGFLKWSQGLATNEGFKTFVAWMKTNGPIVWKFLGDIVTAVWNLGVALEPMGSKVLGFVSGMLSGEGAGGRFSDMLMNLWNNVLVPLGNYIWNTAIPAVKRFAQEFENGTGPGGKFRTFLEGLWNDVVVPFYKLINEQAIPAIKNFATAFNDGTGAPGLFKDAINLVADAIHTTITATSDVIGFLRTHKTVAEDLTAALGFLLIAYGLGTIALGVQKDGFIAWLVQFAIVKAAIATWTGLQVMFSAATGLMTAAMVEFDIAMDANPIGLISLAIMALIVVVGLIASKTTWFQTAWEYSWHAIQKVTGAVVAQTLVFVKGLFDGFMWAFGGFIHLASLIPGPWQKAMQAADKTISTFKANGDKKFNDMIKSASGWGTGVGTNYAAGLGGTASVGKSVAAAERDAAGAKRGLYFDAYPIGANAAQGLANGILSRKQAAINAASLTAGSAAHAMMKALQTSSPSKVTHAIGVFVSQGLANGMKAGSATVIATAATLAKDLIATLGKTRGTAWINVIKPIENHLIAIAKARESVATKLVAANAKLQAAITLRNDFAASVRAGVAQLNTVVGIGASNSIVGLTGNDIVLELQDRLADIKKFNTDLAALKKQGLNNTAYKELVDAGAMGGGGEAAAAMLAGGAGVISQVNSLQAQITGAGNSLATSTSTVLYQAGVNAAQGLVNGLNSQAAALARSATAYANILVKAIKKALGIKSPSTVMAQQGIFIGLGLVKGIESQKSNVEAAMASLVTQPKLSLTLPPNKTSGTSDGTGDGKSHIGMYLEKGAIELSLQNKELETRLTKTLTRVAAFGQFAAPAGSN